MYKSIYSRSSFVVVKNWKLKGCPSNGEWLNELWYMNVMEYFCAIKNDKGKTHMNWCWVKGGEPGELYSHQQPQCLKNFSGRLCTSLQCKDLKNSQWSLKAKCLPHPEKEIQNLIAEWIRSFSFILCFHLFYDFSHSF